MRFFLIILLIAVASFLVMFLLDRVFRKKRFIKYIPVMILVALMLYYFYTMNRASNEGFEDLARFIMGIFLLTASLSSLLSAIAFDVYHKRRRRL